jgi:hypothetical protein
MVRVSVLAFLLVCLAFPSSGQDAISVGFPARSVNADWPFQLTNMQDSGPVVYDINQDGVKEVIVAGRNDIFVFRSGDNSLDDTLFHWTAPVTEEDVMEFCSPVTIAHLSTDGKPWVVIGASRVKYYETACPQEHTADVHVENDCYHWRSKLCAYKITGVDAVEDHSPGTVVTDMRLTTPCAADMNGDGWDELCFAGSCSYGPRNHDDQDPPVDWCYRSSTGVMFFRWTGVDFFQWPSPAGNRSFYEFLIEPETGEFACGMSAGHFPAYQIAQTVPAAADIDADGLAEVVAMCVRNLCVYAWPPNGVPSLSWNAFTEQNHDRAFAANTVELYRDLDSQRTEKWQCNIHDRHRVAGPVLTHTNNLGELSIFLQLRTYIDPHGRVVQRRSTVDGSFVSQYGLDLDLADRERCNYSELAIADDGNNGLPDVFGTLTTMVVGEDGVAHDFQQRTRRWDGGLSELAGGEGQFPYDLPLTDPKMYCASDNYTPALLRSQAQNDISVYLSACQSYHEEKCASDVHNQTDFTSGACSEFYWDDEKFTDPQTDVRSSITAADIDGDRLTEYVCSRQDDANGVDNYLSAFNSNVPYNPEWNEWNGFRNGPEHRGLYAQPVSGDQPRTTAKWSGRVIITDDYNVLAGQTLTILPGTVVEFAPDANLNINGNFTAEGLPGDSIYFKSNGSSPWGSISISGTGQIRLTMCVIHGADDGIFATGLNSVIVKYSRIYDCNRGIEMFESNQLQAYTNDIQHCAIAGVYGAFSKSYFNGNFIGFCGGVGVYWNHDAPIAQAPTFESNVIYKNAMDPASALANCAFYNSNAILRCNQITSCDNGKPEIYADHSNIVMNFVAQRSAGNYLANGSSTWAVLNGCLYNDVGRRPLMKLSYAWPAMANGYNTLHFDGNAYFISDPSWWCLNPPRPVHELGHTHYEPAMAAYWPENPPNLPGFMNPQTAYRDRTPDPMGTTCREEMRGPLGGALAAYTDAGLAEEDSNYALASELYSGVISDYPESEEALWSARGYLRVGLLGGADALERHDSLLVFAERDSLPDVSRHTIKRESIQALIAGSYWDAARTEIEAIRTDPSQAEDSVWAVITLAGVDIFEEQGGTLDAMCAPDAASAKHKMKVFRDRVNRALGRPTDDEVLANLKAVPQSKDIATAYPNPFNSTVNIAFELPSAAAVRIDVFNLMGQKVSTLMDQKLDAGSHRALWNATANASGVYFYRLSAGTHVESHKLLLLK